MARKKKTPEPIPMPQRRPTPVESVERVERCGHIDQPLLLLTLLLLGLGLICMFSASYATAYDTQDGNSTYRNYIIDAVYRMTQELLEKGANYEVR
jgi:hypothetical protein